MEKYKDFTRLFPVQKTLRMGLVPVGRTLDNIQRNEVLQGDEQLASNFSLVKPLLDKYHKHIIEVVLDGLTLDNGLLAEYAALLEHKHEKGVDKSIAKIQDTLCSYIAKSFSAYPDFHKLWKKEMFTELMPAFLQDADERNAVAAFANHVGYFTDYNSVRKNIYDAKSRNGAVAARIVCDNFPLFVYNCKIINKILQNPVYAGLRDDMAIIYSSFEEYLNVGCLEEMFQIRYFTRMLCQSQLDVYNMILGGKTVSPEAKLKGLNEVVGDRVVHVDGVPDQVGQEGHGVLVDGVGLGDDHAAALGVVVPGGGIHHLTGGPVHDLPPALDVVAGVDLHQLRGDALHQGDVQSAAGSGVEAGHDVALLDLVRIGLGPDIVLAGGVVGGIDLGVLALQLCGEVGAVAVADGVCAPALHDLERLGDHIQVRGDGHAACSLDITHFAKLLMIYGVLSVHDFIL